MPAWKSVRLAALLLASAVAMTTPALATDIPCAPLSDPLVIGHRGASGYVPEHTLEAYSMAIEMGADYVEPDLVITKDGVLVARHENEISGTTNVADKPQFAARRTTKSIDGVEVQGWFTEDFTLAELRTLRAKERIPAIRPTNTRLDGIFVVPTFEEVLLLVRGANHRFYVEAKTKNKPTRRCIGVYPETKHPTFFQGIGLPLERPLVWLLHQNGFSEPDDRAYIQSFEVANLKALRSRTRLPLVQLISNQGAPYDFVAAGDSRTYADLISNEGLDEIATYAQGIGTFKELLIPRTPDNRLGSPTDLIARAHARGLIVHGWTFRAENNFLPRELRRDGGTDPTQLGYASSEILRHVEEGMDGFFTDHPDVGAHARWLFNNRP